MLMQKEYIINVLRSLNIDITGVLHIGAHECEEMPFYKMLGLKDNDVIWIDAISEKVEQAKNRGVPNMYNAVVTDSDDMHIDFNISSNNESSSVLEFGTHTTEHPHVFFTSKIEMKSITVDTFFERNGIDGSKCNFWNFDIQGAELMALKGAINSIKHAKVLYLEINEKELYKGCALVDEIDEFLKQYNFARVHTVMTPHGWGDGLYIKF
jgi:FkbM family methyltransferase